VDWIGLDWIGLDCVLKIGPTDNAALTNFWPAGSTNLENPIKTCQDEKVGDVNFHRASSYCSNFYQNCECGLIFDTVYHVKTEDNWCH